MTQSLFLLCIRHLRVDKRWIGEDESVSHRHDEKQSSSEAQRYSPPEHDLAPLFALCTTAVLLYCVASLVRCVSLVSPSSGAALLLAACFFRGRFCCETALYAPRTLGTSDVHYFWSQTLSIK